MLKMDPGTLRMALKQLNAAADDHAMWQENILRAVVCRIPCASTDLVEDAHLNCRFGRWYYERAPAELWGLPVFAAIGSEHELLHRIGARLLRAAATGMPIASEDFEGFVEVRAQLSLALDSLRDAIQAGLRNRDALTGAYDRAEMLPELRQWSELAKRQVQPCCIVFMDLDHLKEINDTHGHAVGDEFLAGAVRYVTAHLRPFDKVFRYGGDEFLISLPGADLAIAQMVIKRIREGLASRPLITGRGGIELQVTASFGLALLDPDVSVEECIERADQALLLAKTAGRNRAINWDSSVTTGTRIPRLQLDDVDL